MYFWQNGSGGEEVYLPWFNFPSQKFGCGGRVGDGGVKFGHSGASNSPWSWHILWVQIYPGLHTESVELPIQDLKLYGPVHINISFGEHCPEQNSSQSACTRELGGRHEAPTEEAHTVPAGQLWIGPSGRLLMLHWRNWFSFKQVILVVASQVPQTAASELKIQNI